MRKILRPVLIVLAVIFLIEAWLWDRLEPVIAWLVARIPLKELKRRIAAAIDRFPPPASLVVFVVPVVMLFPLKIAGLWLLARGAVLSATAVLVFAKLAGVGITAFVFDATREKLLMMRWFRALYDRVMAWRAWAHALVDPIKQRIRLRMRLLVPQRSRRAYQLFKRMRLIRRRMHTPATPR